MSELKNNEYNLVDILVEENFEFADRLLERDFLDFQVNQVSKKSNMYKNHRPLEIISNMIGVVQGESLLHLFSVTRRLLEKGATTTVLEAVENILNVSEKHSREEVARLAKKLLDQVKYNQESNLVDLLLDQKYDEVDQLLNQELSVEQVNRQGTSDKTYPIEVVYEKLMKNEVQYDSKQLALFFSFARRLIEKGARMVDEEIYREMLELAEDQQEESLVFLLKASMYTREELELELDQHLTEATKVSAILKLKSQLDKMSKY